MSNQHNDPYANLSRREHQIMDIVFRLGEASAAQIQENLPDAPGYSSVRVLLTIMEKKGYLQHRRERTQFIYSATVATDKAKQSALQHLIKTFFNGSVPDVISALFSVNEINEDDLAKIAKIIEDAKADGGGEQP